MSIRIEGPKGNIGPNSQDAQDAKTTTEKSAKNAAKISQDQPGVSNQPRAIEAPKEFGKHSANAGQQSPRLGEKSEAALKREAAALGARLQQGGKVPRSAAQEALVLAASYAMRRSKGARRTARALCADVANADIEGEWDVDLALELRKILGAEMLIHDNDAANTLRALRGLIETFDAELLAQVLAQGHQRLNAEHQGDEDTAMENPTIDRRTLQGMARATAAHGFVHLALHFPQALQALGLSAEEALAEAMHLAEEAVVLAPHIADGHTALARVLLCSDSTQAIADAEELLGHALELDGNHDPARIGLGVVALQRGAYDDAKSLADQVLHAGNGMAQPLVLRALAQCQKGEIGAAKRDILRAVALAPQIKSFHEDAIEILVAAGEEDLAQEIRLQLLAHASNEPSG